MDPLPSACMNFGFTISLKKTDVMAQEADELSEISIKDCVVEFVHEFANSSVLSPPSLSKNYPWSQSERDAYGDGVILISTYCPCPLMKRFS